ncbi:hypothetical protein ES703_80415 [subsurface metagenome]
MCYSLLGYQFPLELLYLALSLLTLYYYDNIQYSYDLSIGTDRSICQVFFWFSLKIIISGYRYVKDYKIVKK